MTAVQLTSEEIQILKNILTGDYKVLLFGSRIQNKAKPYSDLDICIKSKKPLSDGEMGDIKEKFQNSNLPFFVDLVLYDEVSDDFKKIIDQTCVDFKEIITRS